MWYALWLLAVRPPARGDGPCRPAHSPANARARRAPASLGPVAARFPAGRFTLWVLDVGLACCAVEVVAASLRASTGPVADRPPDVLVVAGTLSDTMAPAIKRLYDELPEPKHVISFGACADCGGPYWDSYCVTKGVDQLIPVDVYVPGCPPRPEALLDALRVLESRIDAPVAG
jgi:NADH-quinone oxidoreductase subunit B